MKVIIIVIIILAVFAVGFYFGGLCCNTRWRNQIKEIAKTLQETKELAEKLEAIKAPPTN